MKVTLGILGCMTMQGPSHPVGHRPSQAPRALGQPRRPALAARRLRRRLLGRRSGVRARARRLDVLESRNGAGPGSTGRISTRIACSVWLDRLYLLWVAISRSGFRSRSGTSSAAGRSRSGSRHSSGEASSVIFLYQHATFSVNSICHMFGRRGIRLARRGAQQLGRRVARLRRGLAQQPPCLPGLSASRSEPVQFDVSWWVIRTMERVGLVWNVKTPSGDQRARRRLLPES